MKSSFTYFLALFFLSFVCLFNTVQAQVRINEYSASNLTDYIDDFGKTEDWIELYNDSDSPVDLSGWYLSDKENNPTKWEIPSGVVLEPNGFITFWCSGRDTAVGHLHTNFKLTQSKSNEFVVLTQPNGNIVQSLPVELTLLGHSRSFKTDGGDTLMVCTEPTLGTSNHGAPMFCGYTKTPELSMDAGFYAGEQSVTISTNEPNVEVRYTTDGTAPTLDDELNTDSTVITISNTQILKARAFSNDSTMLPGKIVFNTYFIDEDFTLPVFSVGADQIIELANGNGVLRPIGSLEYFTVEKQRTSTAYGELNRHGQDSWVNDHRSLDWVTRDEMGYTNVLKEKLFSYSDRVDYQRFMFRASGDDNYPATNDPVHDGSAHIRDEYVHTLAQEGDMKLDIRAVERVIVFLNGQYWGVYGLRERPVDHDYTKEYYDQDKYHLHYLNTWGNTWAEYGGQAAFDDWIELRDFILENDMSDSANYEVVKDEIRLLSMIDYFIANLNSVASDWLNYNTAWWRGIDPDGDHKKWGYSLWDNDATFDYYINYSGVPNTDPDAQPCDIIDISDYMDQFFGNGWGYENVGKHEKIFLKLQAENEEFRQLYYSRQADLMNTVYTCESMLSILDSMVATIAPEMPRQISRWGGSLNEWEQNVQRLRDFIEIRCTLLDDGMVDCFNLTGPFNLTLMVEPAGAGEIELNTLDIESFPWSGNYFGNMENLVKAKPNDPALPFLEWRSTAGHTIFPDNKTSNARIVLEGVDTLVAVFGLPNQTVEIESGLSFSAYPTIINDELTLEYELDESMNVEIGLYDIIGKKIAGFTEASGQRPAGRFTYPLNLAGREVTPGIYFLNFKAGQRQGAIKVVVAR